MSGATGNAVHNARIQLLATLLNTMAGSSFTVGIAAPLAAMFFYSPANLRFAPAVIGSLYGPTSLASFIWPHARFLEGLHRDEFRVVLCRHRAGRGLGDWRHSLLEQAVHPVTWDQILVWLIWPAAAADSVSFSVWLAHANPAFRRGQAFG
jgi:hypothetical protein